MKLIFLPVSVAAGVLAGSIAKKIVEGAWGRIEDQEPPQPDQREVGYGKLAVALVLEGAIVRLIRGLVDHGARHGFYRLAGSWPGEEPSQPE